MSLHPTRMQRTLAILLMASATSISCTGSCFMGSCPGTQLCTYRIDTGPYCLAPPGTPCAGPSSDTCAAGCASTGVCACVPIANPHSCDILNEPGATCRSNADCCHGRCFDGGLKAICVCNPAYSGCLSGDDCCSGACDAGSCFCDNSRVCC
jgi:hypothetical protein